MNTGMMNVRRDTHIVIHTDIRYNVDHSLRCVYTFTTFSGNNCNKVNLTFNKRKDCNGRTNDQTTARDRT